MISAPLIRFVLTAAFRDKLMMTLVLMILMSAGVSVFLGGSGLTEQESFALVFGAGGLRFLCVIGLVLGVGGFIAVQGLVFTLLLLVAAAFDFIRREF